jgi:hypothetical protein
MMASEDENGADLLIDKDHAVAFMNLFVLCFCVDLEL